MPVGRDAARLRTAAARASGPGAPFSCTYYFTDIREMVRMWGGDSKKRSID
ncbi:hypothetical protein Ssi02_66660 [Sinosporangium siamense]|uniref:Uncharacterized protein n=1 Tax=Sinosporangium siamense TaxID=1367973 RepID=A0A919V8S5_9ACTN|nr:hypothetical protein Ssi02_66660 [Sinosporangium siamense]